MIKDAGSASFGMLDYARFLWDTVLGFVHNTFHDRTVLSNMCQVRFILHVEHERSCMESMVQNWAMMQRRLPARTSCMTPKDTNMIDIDRP